MMNFKHTRAQGGFSLIELLLVLAIIAALAVAAFIVYPRVQAGRQADAELKVLIAAKAGIKAMFSANNYANLNTQVASDADMFPKHMIMPDGTIQNPFGGLVELGPSDADGYPAIAGAGPVRHFRIVYRNVPAPVCIRMVGALSEHFETVRVSKNNTTGGSFGPISSGPSMPSPDYSQIADKCNPAAGQPGAAITVISR